MAVDIFDGEGNSIADEGLPGEMVCTRPHPSMPLCFWGDSDDKKYRAAYFDLYPGNALSLLICCRITDAEQASGIKAISQSRTLRPEVTCSWDEGAVA